LYPLSESKTSGYARKSSLKDFHRQTVQERKRRAERKRDVAAGRKDTNRQ
jgi:hypothetical protein